MDPDEALSQMRTALVAGDSDTAAQRAADLDQWLSRGGFPPAAWHHRKQWDA